MLTKVEAIRFVTNVLNLENAEYAISRNKYDFLCQLCCSIQNIAHQSVTLMSVPSSDRRRPTVDEVKSALLEGKGGLCYTLNLFMFNLLTALGYDAYLNSATVGSPNNHLIVLVYNLQKDGDIYLVDIGCASPGFTPINLDFETESAEYQESLVRFKFVKKESTIQCLHYHLPFDLSPDKPKPKGFSHFFSFHLNPTRNVDGFNTFFDDVYTNPNLTPFHRSLRAVKFVNKRMVVICNMRLVLELEDGQFHMATFINDDELKTAYHQYFPEFDKLDVERAIYNWRSEVSKDLKE